MTSEEIREMFDDDDIEAEEYTIFDHIPEERKLSGRADLHAMMLLDSLKNGTEDILGQAEHDMVTFSVSISDLAKISYLTRENVLDLIRCGVFNLYGDGETLSMYV